MNKEEILKNLSEEDADDLLKALQEKQKQAKVNKREAYETLRKDFMKDVKTSLIAIRDEVVQFKEAMDKNSDAFREVMAEYGQLRHDDQQGFTIIEGDFKLSVKFNKVKQFDERADMAAQKLIDYLSAYIEKSDKGVEDPIYQLAMSLLERNRQGKLDYKSISKLYELEDKFDEEYKIIMDLFRESNVVQSTVTNYYFWQMDEKHVWHKIEPSFCRI